jgi:3-methyladenine DNA glycosylase/8-oxoguanine DNA glycosylase
VIESEVVGPGAAWTEAFLERMWDFPPQELPASCQHAGLRFLARDLAGLRVGPVPWAMEVAVAYVLQQRVRFVEAARSYVELVKRHGLPAPGPLPLRLPLSSQQWRQLGVDRMQQAGIDPKRARTLLRVCQLSLDFTAEQLAGLRGIGPWTEQSVRGLAFGDPDAVPLGDVHLPRVVGAYLAPGQFTDDALMVELLEPYRGLRFRVIQWIMAASQHRAF